MSAMSGRAGDVHRGFQKNVLNSSERDRYGATVTLREQTSRETRVLARTGTAMDALREIVAEADAWEGDWRVLSISTPATIFRDLQGHRFSSGGIHGEAVTIEADKSEKTYLAKIGRTDLLPNDGPTAVLLPRTVLRRRK